jgi:atypical dual specificity phosphatase
VTAVEDRADELNFSWLEDHLVAGCRGPRTDRDLALLSDFGVRALVRLASEDETGLVWSEVERHEIRDCYEPVSDWTSPSQEQLDRVIEFMKTAVENGEPVAVSCGAGKGRTGTVLGCYLVARGMRPQAAIEELIAVRACSDEILRVPGQKDAVFDFYRRMKDLDRDRGAV